MDRTQVNLFEKLSDEQKSDLLLAYEERFEEENLLDHEIVKQQHVKWLNNQES